MTYIASGRGLYAPSRGLMQCTIVHMLGRNTRENPLGVRSRPCFGVVFEEMACPEGLEPPTCCLEGSCSIQLSYGQAEPQSQAPLPRGACKDKKGPQGGPFCFSMMVGAAGFELATLCSQSRCATRLRYAPTKLSIVTFSKPSFAWPSPYGKNFCTLARSKACHFSWFL